MQTMLSPRPGTQFVARVIVIATSDDGKWAKVLDIGRLHQNPESLKKYNPGYVKAVRFYDVVVSIIAISGILLSFFWHWWSFIAGSVLSFVVYRANQKSAADFALEVLRDPSAEHDFEKQGLVWAIEQPRLVPA